MAKKKNLLCPSSFLLRRSPSNVRSTMPLHLLLVGLHDYQAFSVGLRMDVYMHRLQEARSQSTVYRLTGFEVMASLRRNTLCLSVILFYVVKMKIRLCVSVQGAGCFISSLKLTRTLSIRDRLLLSSKLSSLHCNAWEMFEHWRTNNRWVRGWEFFVTNGWQLICRENLNEKTSAYVIPRQLREWGSSGEEARVLACTAILYWTYRAELTNDPGFRVYQNEWQWSRMLRCGSAGKPLFGLRLRTTRCATGKQWLRHLHSNSVLPKQQVTRRRRETL